MQFAVVPVQAKHVLSHFMQPLVGVINPGTQSKQLSIPPQIQLAEHRMHSPESR